MPDNTARAPRHRSPTYPAFSLKSALGRATLIYKAHRQFAAAVDDIKRSMEYALNTSHGMRAISALIQYGLLEEEGVAASRRLKLSEACLKILLRREDDPARLEVIRQAALKPAVFRLMADRWRGELPTDATISSYLLFERNFNPQVVPNLVRDYRLTREFARIAESESVTIRLETVSQPEEDETAVATPANADYPLNGGSAEMSAVALHERSTKPSYRLPLPGGGEALLSVPRNLTVTDIDFVTRYLDLMREALASSHLSEQPENSPRPATGKD